MRHTEEVTITVKGLSAKPQSYKLPHYIGQELHAYIEAKAYPEERIPAREAFPILDDDVQRPALMLRGLRYREQMTQKQLAEKLGIRQHHLSEMENAKRPISKDMAKKLAVALNTKWKIFF